MLWQVMIVFTNSVVMLLVGLAYVGLTTTLTTNYVVGSGAILFGILGVYVAIRFGQLANRIGKLHAPDEL